ncbi:MAG: putative ABC transporter permease [Clostridium sp.]|nr:putative ABC transporter permease [Clostridium sp.]MCM1444446.1 putative ABC transporter permease [Candidatus Amulumruptor caecigallinarius]
MKEKFFQKYSNTYWVILIGSFVGFIHENLLTILKGKFILRQGLIYEPLIPIYGIGSLVFYLIYKKLNLESKSSALQIMYAFIIGFLVGGITEYTCSFIQEKFFGTISWDYSNLKFDLNGRTSLFHAIFWGIAGVFFYKVLFPFIKKIQKAFTNEYVKVLTISLSVFLLIDASISALACYRRQQRLNKIDSNNFLAEFLDKAYPDEFIDRIYSNTMKVNK